MSGSELLKILKEARSIAVVGASRNPNKWGNRIVRLLVEKLDARVYPVNPKAKEILGLKAYPSISTLPEVPDVVVTVVPPRVTRAVAEEATRIGVKILWMQPGSESREAEEVAREAGIRVVKACVVVTLSRAGSEEEQPHGNR